VGFMGGGGGLRDGDFYHCFLVRLVRDLDLRDLDFRNVWRVCWYEASVAAAVAKILLAEVVFVKEPASEARNADKKASWTPVLSLARCQWPRPRTAFHDGTGCRTVRVRVGIGLDGGERGQPGADGGLGWGGRRAVKLGGYLSLILGGELVGGESCAHGVGST